ncbi:MAG: DNA repair protein RecN [Alphaproteobacteria bacterium]|nr:DNA repair protein RecN [Alphaproteobacteria bacterium]
MLVSLSIRDIILIDRLDLDFGSGLTILTGETGAGKSILLDAFSLALGARGDGAMVRQGQPQGEVSATFILPPGHPALEVAQAQQIVANGHLVLRRIQLPDGRGRAFVNDQKVGTQALRAIARELVEIHGQHDDRALINAGTHRQLVDAYGGLTAEVSAVCATYKRLRALHAEIESESARLAKARSEADYLRHAAGELSALAVETGEEPALAERRVELMQAEKVRSELREAQAAVSGEYSPVQALSGTLRRLDRRQAQAPGLIAPVIEALDGALIAFDLAGQAIDLALQKAEFDPRELERIEERLFALRGASRKYAVPIDGLPALAKKFSAELATNEASEARLLSAKQEGAAAETAYKTAAERLSTARAKAAARLDASVNAELAPLKLEGARFMTEIYREADGPEGYDQISFWVQTNPGTKPGPLMKIASGGELARFMLALKVVLAHRGSAPTLVFDEIDTGAGGAVADAIGQRLAKLAVNVQVLAVTHAPQVAARATGHFRIAKDRADRGQRVATRVTHLEEEARREEIARMLAGATVTDEARAAARRLLEGAQ